MIRYLKRGLEVEVTSASLARALAENDRSVPSADIERLAEVVFTVVSGVPDALQRVLGMSKDERCGQAIGFAVGSILKYLVDPDDLISESEQGHIGLLDDSYLVHTFVTQLAMTYPYAVADTIYAGPNKRALNVVAALLPDGVAQSLARTCETIILVAQGLFVAGRAGAPSTNEHKIKLRVAAAVDALAAAGEHQHSS
ncbi:MAG TPA: hypothetical protein VE487_03005 [Ilumatobacter sp.]|jgi:hypothetical protein|nr:hypothetical protein [Ilumatobacter sp.]